MGMIIAAKSKTVGEKLVVTFFLIEGKALALPGHAMEKSPLYPLLKSFQTAKPFSLFPSLSLQSTFGRTFSPFFSALVYVD